MASTITALWGETRADTKKCIVGRYLNGLPDEERDSLSQMIDNLSGYKVYHLLLTVDGIDLDNLPSSHAFRMHKIGRCRCHR